MYRGGVYHGVSAREIVGSNPELQEHYLTPRDRVTLTQDQAMSIAFIGPIYDAARRSMSIDQDGERRVVDAILGDISSEEFIREWPQLRRDALDDVRHAVDESRQQSTDPHDMFGTAGE